MMNKKLTREEWLQQMVDYFKADFRAAGFPIDDKKIRVGVGFPSRRGTVNSHRTIGQAFSKVNSSDGTYEVICSITISDSVEVAATLIHELCHIALDGYLRQSMIQHGHRKNFRRLALKIGLCSQMRATQAGEKLIETIQTLVSLTGEYPHSSLKVEQKGRSRNRMIKCECKNDGYTIRLSRLWLQRKHPICPICMAKMNVVNYSDSLPKGHLV